MTTRLNSSSLVHHNSWKSQIISVYVWVTQIFISCHAREILVVGLILGCPWHHTSAKVCASSFYYIYNIRRIRNYLSRQSAEILVHAFISSRLDYCNGLLYGLLDCLLNKLQRVQNACARLIFREQKFCHVTPLIYELHWLPIK